MIARRLSRSPPSRRWSCCGGRFCQAAWKIRLKRHLKPGNTAPPNKTSCGRVNASMLLAVRLHLLDLPVYQPHQARAMFEVMVEFTMNWQHPLLGERTSTARSGAPQRNLSGAIRIFRHRALLTKERSGLSSNFCDSRNPAPEVNLSQFMRLDEVEQQRTQAHTDRAVIGVDRAHNQLSVSSSYLCPFLGSDSRSSRSSILLVLSTSPLAYRSTLAGMSRGSNLLSEAVGNESSSGQQTITARGTAGAA